ncbi:hypothetical protein OH491_24400 [Termitidicoccus mucosus]|uniref:hypothetical protein n=1 Tax=Termitidicoccus mucosus TaxID=1184151 RepID=UPI0011AB7604
MPLVMACFFPGKTLSLFSPWKSFYAVAPKNTVKSYETLRWCVPRASLSGAGLECDFTGAGAFESAFHVKILRLWHRISPRLCLIIQVPSGMNGAIDGDFGAIFPAAQTFGPCRPLVRFS